MNKTLTSESLPPAPSSEPTSLEIVEEPEKPREVIPGVPALEDLPRVGKSTISFFTGGGEPVITLEPDGRILIHGREAGTDIEVVDALRDFLRAAGGELDELRAILGVRPGENLADAARRAVRR